MKRWLSMLLCVAMLTPYVQSAGDNTQIAGVGGYSPGFSTSQGGKQRSKYPSPTDPNGAGAGLMLSVETIPVDITYTIKDGKRGVNTEQYKKVVEHFTKWLPSTNPTTGNARQAECYPPNVLCRSSRQRGGTDAESGETYSGI